MIKWLADRMQEMSFGQNMLSKFTAAATFANMVMLIAITFKVNLNKWIMPAIILMLFIMWLVGWVCEITGFRKKFREAEFKDVELP